MLAQLHSSHFLNRCFKGGPISILRQGLQLGKRAIAQRFGLLQEV